MLVGRLAPSPTGALHLGNARSFLLAWLSVRSQNGQILLRIEDIDSPRVKPWAVDQTIADLTWLGLDWDFGPTDQSESLDAIPLVQSKRMDRYRAILSELIDRDLVYPCSCSRTDVQTAASAPHDRGTAYLDGVVYPGTCRVRDWKSQSPSGKFSWRWRFEMGEIGWTDELRGRQHLNAYDALGDFVIARVDQATDFHDTSNATPAYQLAVIVDDHDRQVNEVLRGDDLIYSTYRQVAILRELAWNPPAYIHVPLLVGADGRRLAKRHGDTRLASLKDCGIEPEAIVGYLAWTVGLLPSRDKISTTELLQQLNSDSGWKQRIPKEETIFDRSQELPKLLDA